VFLIRVWCIASADCRRLFYKKEKPGNAGLFVAGKYGIFQFDINHSGFQISHSTRIFLLTTFAMIAFAGNSLLCRLALKNEGIDAASFTIIRLISGALVLWFLIRPGKSTQVGKGSWMSGLALFVYAAGFSFAYLNLSAAMGALLLFGSVQITMIVYGIWKGERLKGIALIGFLISLAGFVGLLSPGIAAPPLLAALLMSISGIAWGVYSLRGKNEGDPLQVTAGNFVRASVIGAVFCIVIYSWMMPPDLPGFSGVIYAVCSGAITSGLGYAIWYSVLPTLKTTTAAIVQLSVPAIAAMGGVLLLHEPVGLRLVLASIAILGGIALFVSRRRA